ncbi:Kinesin-like protein KIF2C, partial [Geodia barretti]
WQFCGLHLLLCVVWAGRKSSCVREVERLKKNREERRARLAGKIAQRKEDYDTSHPQWEFLQMIREYCSHLDLRPLVGNESVTFHRICVCVRKRPLNKKGDVFPISPLPSCTQ